MKESMRHRVDALARRVLNDEEYDLYKNIPFHDEGHGYDIFGFEKESGLIAYLLGSLAYNNWFRVESQGHENIPKEGRAMLVCNHSGILPIDGGMIAIDCLKKLRPPRAVRSVVDRFFMGYPYVGMLLRRVGQITGMKRDFVELLERDELSLVFPEGQKGNGKHFSQRYKLQRFNVGFMEIALGHRTPIIPTCVIGAEEQAPLLLNIKPLAKLLGFPFFPITPTFPHMGPIGMIPLPVKYHIYYGTPIHLYEEYGPEVAGDPPKVRALVEQVRSAIQEMINKGLEQRTGIFV